MLGKVQHIATLVYKPDSFSVHGSVMGFVNILSIVVNYRKLRMTWAENYRTTVNQYGKCNTFRTQKECRAVVEEKPIFLPG